MSIRNHRKGLLALVHPVTGDFVLAHRGEGHFARALILQGYEPCGPRGQAAAQRIRAEAHQIGA